MREGRRQFILTSAMALTSALVIPNAFCKTNRISPGLQLYTVRHAMREDLKGTMKKISEIGYKFLETASYRDRKFHGANPKEFNRIAKDLGLSVISSHIDIGPIRDNLNQILEDLIATEQEYLVVPWLEESYRTADGFKGLADLLNRSGEICNKAGVKLIYHNHAWEFNDLNGTTGMEILLSHTQDDLVMFEPDFYWLTKAGIAPIEFLNKNRNRCPLWHVKDMDNTSNGYFTEVGSGIIDYGKIFEYSNLSGLKYFFVEQDQSENPIKSIETSFNGLTRIR